MSGDWDELVRSSEDGWPFALTAWQNVILSVAEWGLVEKSFYVTSKERLVAALPLQFNLHTKALSSSGWGCSGPIIAPGLSDKEARHILAFVLHKAQEIGYDIGANTFEYAVSPVTRASIQSHWGINSSVFYGFEDVSGISQVIDLARPESDLWRGVSETARHSIKRAKAAGCTVRECPWPEMLDSYYSMHAATYRRTGVQPHPKSYFEGISRLMWPLKHSVLWVAFDQNNQPIAFNNSIYFKEGGFYHTACSATAALENGANYLLFWNVILAAKTSGVRWYDCGEITPNKTNKASGLATFKKKFGGEPHRLFRSRKSLAAGLVDARSFGKETGRFGLRKLLELFKH